MESPLIESADDETKSVPISSSGQAPKDNPEKDEAVRKRNGADETWKGAVTRLYRTVVSMSTGDGGFASPVESLNSLLDEVAKNEAINEKELLQRLRSRTNRTSSTGDAAESSEAVQSEATMEKEVTEKVDTSQPDLEEVDEFGTRKHHELFNRLAKVGELLSDSGSTGLQDLNNMLFNETETTKYQTAIEYVTTKLQEQWDHVLNVLLPQQQLHTLILVSVVNIVSAERVFGFLPFVVCYASFLLMMYSTLAMFGSRKWLRQAENWKRLLLIFRDTNADSTVASDGGTSLYSWKTTEPYVTYFISLLLFAFSLALAGGDGAATLPNSWSMCAVSAFFAIVCFVALADWHDKLSLWVMAFDLTSSIPAILFKCGAQLADLPVIGYLLSNWELCRLGLVKLQVGLPSMAFVCMVGMYGFMIVCYPRRDVLSLVVPHVVCAAWWHTSLELFLVSDFRVFFSAIGWYEVALTVGVIWLVTFPTVAALVLVAAVVVAQLKNIVDTVGLIKTAATGTILLLPVLYWKFRQLAERRNWKATVSGKGRLKTTMLALIVYGLLVFTAVALLYESKLTAMDAGGRAKTKGLAWTQFERHCSFGDENLGNRLQQQIACSQLAAVAVNWKGTIQGVRIAKIDNIFETVLSYLPDELASRFRCLYGDRMNQTAGIGSVIQGLELGACTLVKRDVYTFEIDVAGPWGQQTLSSAKGTVTLVASPNFQEIAMEFEQGDVVDFTGTFVANSLLKYPPRLNLVQLQCIACQHVSKENQAKRFVAAGGGAMWTKLFNACCFLFNFVFSPFLVIN